MRQWPCRPPHRLKGFPCCQFGAHRRRPQQESRAVYGDSSNVCRLRCLLHTLYLCRAAELGQHYARQYGLSCSRCSLHPLPKLHRKRERRHRTQAASRRLSRSQSLRGEAFAGTGGRDDAIGSHDRHSFSRLRAFRCSYAGLFLGCKGWLAFWFDRLDATCFSQNLASLIIAALHCIRRRPRCWVLYACKLHVPLRSTPLCITIIGLSRCSVYSHSTPRPSSAATSSSIVASLLFVLLSCSTHSYF